MASTVALPGNSPALPEDDIAGSCAGSERKGSASGSMTRPLSAAARAAQMGS